VTSDAARPCEGARRGSDRSRRPVAALAVLISGGFFVLTSLPAAAQQAAGSSDCVEVDVGNEHVSSLGCLNQRLQRLVEHAHDAAPPTPPIDAQSPSNVVGTANHAAAQEKMGDAFGKSATPQRPQTFYASPLLQIEHH
jgi:hypothetical protein